MHRGNQDGGHVHEDYDSHPRDLRGYQLRKPVLDEELFFLYDTEEELSRPNAIEQPSMNQHQLIFCRDPNFWVSNAVLDGLFGHGDGLYGHGLVEYPGSKGTVFVKSWQGTYKLGGELPWKFPDPFEGVQTLYVLGRARWFFANVNNQRGQMGELYPGPWSPWSDKVGVSIEEKYRDYKYTKVFKPGTPGLFWWKRSKEKPQMPASVNGKEPNMRGWSCIEIKEDRNRRTFPVWRVTIHKWMDYHYKAIKRSGVVTYTPDESRPMYPRWDCKNLIAVDPELQFKVERAEEEERRRERDRRLKEKEDRERKIREQKERMAKRRREWAEQDRRQAEIDRQKAEEKKRYLAERKREEEARMFNDRYNEIMNYKKDMGLSKDQLAELVRRGYYDDTWNAYDPVFEKIAEEQGFSL